jgi:competence protein ComEC
MNLLYRISGFLSLSIIIVISISNIQDCFSFSKQNSNLTIIFLYPESHGQANLLILPNGKSMMIDMGPRRLSETIIETMNNYNLSKLDSVIISHKHPDHTAGINEVIKENIIIEKIYDSGTPHKKKTYDDPDKIDLINEYLKLVKQKKIPFIKLQEGNEIHLDTEIKIEILNPPNPLFKGGSSTNNNSIVIKLTYKNFSILFPGDIYSIVEQQLLGKNLDSDVLLLPHHGNKESSSVEFLKAVNPDVSIVSTREDNPFGYPHSETVERLKNLKIPLLELTKYGTLTLSTDGNNFDIYANYPSGIDSKSINGNLHTKTVKVFGNNTSENFTSQSKLE